MADLSGRVALVTGGSRGIGAAIAVDLARAGAAVAVNYHRNAAAAEEVRARIEEAGGRAAIVGADVGSVPEIRRMFDEVEAALGPVDVLVNNAGIEIRASSLEVTEAEYDRMLDTNLKGAFFCAQRAIAGMKERGWGRVINVSSVHERSPTGYSAPYSMSKGGMLMMTRELAFELSRFGVTINNVAPGAVRTDINREVLADPAYEAKVVAKTPARIIGEPEDVSRAVVFLAAEEARFITGASFFVDGGIGL